MTVPGLGETVGRAYIRILADGSGLPHSIRDAYRRAGPQIDRSTDLSAREAARGWSDGFDRELRNTKKGLFFNSIVGQMRANRRRIDDTANFLGSSWARNFRTQLGKELTGRGGQEVADRVFKNLSDAFQRTGNVQLFRAGLTTDLQRQVARAVDQIRADQERLSREEKRIAAERLRDGDALLRQLKQVAGARRQAFEKADLRFAHKDFERVNNDLRQMSLQWNDVDKSSNDATLHIAQMRSVLSRLAGENEKIERGFAVVDRRVRDGVRDVGTMEHRMRRMEDSVRRIDIGRIFGKGSRNDFFNILGSIVGKLGEAVALAGPRMLRALLSWGSALGQADNKMKFLSGSLSRGLLLVGRAATGAVLGLAALQLIAGPLAAAISELAGVVVALAGSIGIGLVGAVSAALPLLGVLVTGIAVFALAFKGFQKFSDAQKKVLTQRLKPIIDDYHQLRDVATKGLFSDLDNQVPLLHRFMQQSAIPIVKAAAHTMALSMTGFLQVLSGPIAQRNLGVLRDILPEAGRRLGRVLGNSFKIVSGFLVAATPIAMRFLRAIEASTARVARLVNSAKGQNRLKKWLDDAYDSARTVWKFLTTLSKVIFDLLEAGQPTGDNIFDSWTKSLQHFDDWLNSAAGVKSLKKWFADSSGMLEHLGNALGGLGHLFGTLVTGGGGSLNTILDLIGKIANIIADLLPSAQGLLNTFFDAAGDVLDAAFQALQPLLPVLKDLIPQLSSLFSDVIQIAAPILIGALNVLGDVIGFIADNQAVFGPMIKELLLFWAAWKGYTIVVTAMTALRTALGTTSIVAGLGAFFSTATAAVVGGFRNILFAMRTGTGQALTATEKMASAMGGIGLILSGQITGGLIGGTGGKIASISQGALGGAFIGAPFGPEGAAIGAVIGGLTNAIVGFWQDTSKAADDAKAAQVAAIHAIGAEADLLATKLDDDKNKIGLLSKAFIAQSLMKLPEGGTVSPLDAATQLGLRGKTVVGAAAGEQGAANRLQLQLNPMLLSVNQQIARLQRIQDRGGLSGQAITEDQKTELARLQIRRDLIQQVIDAVGRENASVRQGIRTHDLLAASTTGLNLATRDAKTQAEAYRTALRGEGLAASRNRQFINDHITALEKEAAKQSKTKKAAEGAAQSILDGAAALRKQMVQAGFTGPVIDGLVAKYGKIPKNILTKLAADPTDLDKKIATALFKKGLITKDWLIKIVGQDEATPIIKTVDQGLKDLPENKDVTIRTNHINNTINRTKNITQNIIRPTIGGTLQLPGRGGGPSGGATGGLFTRSTVRMIGEAGPEALVPLQRPLNQVDPAVRWLSAYAQGIASTGPMKRGGTMEVQQRIVNVQSGAILVNTSTTDPVAVATETLNRLVARGGYG